MANFEIEIKSLIGDKQKAEELVAKMKQNDAAFLSEGSHKQLNHYFTAGTNTAILSRIAVLNLSPEKEEQLRNILEQAKDLSVRTRWADGKVFFVIKATVDDTSSSNGTARQEFESEVKMSLEELDQILLDCGFEYQAKWSREREEYKYKDLNVTVDKNAGYGYLAEFEKIIDSADQADQTKQMVRKVMQELGIEELKQDRLERMFDFYNKNWQDYYGTEKVFNIE